jgi:hypothetical protein
MFFIPLGENTLKGIKGAKVKVLFQGLHMIRGIYVLVYNFSFYIVDIQFNIVC